MDVNVNVKKTAVKLTAGWDRAGWGTGWGWGRGPDGCALGIELSGSNPSGIEPSGSNSLRARVG